MEWRSLAMLCSLPTLLMALLITLMPESPQWLLRQGRTSEARQSLTSLRARHSDVSGELQQLFEQQQSISSDSGDSSGSSSGFLADLKYPVVWKPLLLGVLLMSFQQLSGANGLIGCLESVLRQTGDSLDARLAAVLVNSALVLSAWVAAVLVNMLGRKTLLLISAAGYLVSYTMLSTYYALDARPWLMRETLGYLHLDEKTFAWTPVIALFVFFLLHAIGYGAVPWFLVPELCVNAHRAQIAAVCSTVNWTLSFLVMKNFIPMLTYLGSTCTFAIFALLAAASGVYVAVLVPETKGKSSAEIRHIFQKQ
jgi:hypothetical protein